ncbi:Thaumatin [Trema orientale]|uniref:Thaumatin n=1 Tax=Trema orientale TaxID=63057 RepID=A0A2P5FSS6_TREOI|nr:Thaumatin [Trema orientale]
MIHIECSWSRGSVSYIHNKKQLRIQNLARNTNRRRKASIVNHRVRVGARRNTNPRRSGRMVGSVLGRSGCCTNGSGNFTCTTADCASSQVACNGAGSIPPASLVELTLAENGGQDFCDVSLVDGFNLPVTLVPQGRSGVCPCTGRSGNVNTVCPAELAVKGSDGSVVACKSACLALNQPQYCCTGDFGTLDKCPPTDYSKIFKTQ